MADNLRSLTRWMLSVIFAAAIVSSSDMVVPITIMPICFQKLLFLASTLTLDGFMILIYDIYIDVVFRVAKIAFF